VSVETRGAVLVKCTRVISIAGKLGRETVTRRERIKAQKSTIKPKMSKLRAAMAVVGNRWMLASYLADLPHFISLMARALSVVLWRTKTAGLQCQCLEGQSHLSVLHPYVISYWLPGGQSG
jgi:hypothetical protein